jgi:hypothetical protein
MYASTVDQVTIHLLNKKAIPLVCNVRATTKNI